jgi:unsaturated rhamnogalacturonyl hydrolase
MKKIIDHFDWIPQDKCIPDVIILRSNFWGIGGTMKSAYSGLVVVVILAVGLTGCEGGVVNLDVVQDAVQDVADSVEDVSEATPFDWCDGAAPDAACYAARRAPQSDNIILAKAITDRYIDVYPALSLGWTWENTVLMTGIYELYRVTREARYLDYMKAWMGQNIEVGYLMWSSDSTSPALIAAFLFIETGEDKYREVVLDALDYVDNYVTRTEDGGINHWGQAEYPGATLWLDTLFMVGTMLTRWGEFTDDVGPLDEMSDQIEVFTRHLQSKDDGLYVHAWGYNKPVDTEIYWGRGNGWVSAAGFDYLRARRNRGENTDVIAEVALTSQAFAATQVQDQATGLWWIVLNRPNEAYLETSTAALFAYGMARGWRYAYLDDQYLPVIARAMAGIRATLTKDDLERPVVSNVSGPTEAGTFEYYASLPVKDDLGYGVGSVLLALVETSGLPLVE